MAKKVDLPSVGSVVYVDMGPWEHSGIYIGGGKIVSLSRKGKVVKQSRKKFVGGKATGTTIYVSCKNKRWSVGDKKTAKRARKMAGKRRGYNFVFDNCHIFASGCLTGDFDNGDMFLWMLKMQAEDTLGADSWIPWE